MVRFDGNTIIMSLDREKKLSFGLMIEGADPDKAENDYKRLHDWKFTCDELNGKKEDNRIPNLEVWAPPMQANNFIELNCDVKVKFRVIVRSGKVQIDPCENQDSLNTLNPPNDLRGY